MLHRKIRWLVRAIRKNIFVPIRFANLCACAYVFGYNLREKERTMQQIANRKPRNIMYFILVLVGSLSLALCAKDLNSSYRFSVVLHTAEDGGLYELYWKFDNAAETISFAVRVQTTGWVGFGLSPNGQMPDSDVVIGWVTHSGETMFQVCSTCSHFANVATTASVSCAKYSFSPLRTVLQLEEHLPQLTSNRTGCWKEERKMMALLSLGSVGNTSPVMHKICPSRQVGHQSKLDNLSAHYYLAG